MKKINGGEFLLDISELGLKETEESTEIEDAGILEQLTNLKTFIKNPVSIKPIWIRLFNDDTNELVVAKGELSYSSVGEFNIHVKTRGYDLTMSIQFTQMLNDNEDPIDDWYIDDGDATYEFTSNVVSSGTKLYRHVIDFTCQYGDFSATVITTTSQQITTGSNGWPYGKIINVMPLYNDSDGIEVYPIVFQFLYYSSTDRTEAVLVGLPADDMKQITEYNMGYITQVTDTVTEL